MCEFAEFQCFSLTKKRSEEVAWALKSVYFIFLYRSGKDYFLKQINNDKKAPVLQ